MCLRLPPVVTLAVITVLALGTASPAVAGFEPLAALAPQPPKAPAPVRQISTADYRGDSLAQGKLVAGRSPLKYAGRTWVYDTWTSPWTTPGFEFMSLVPSWQVRMVPGTWVQVRVRTQNAQGTTSTWDTIAAWSPKERPVVRRTFSGQEDDLNRVSVDTLLGNTPSTAWQLQLRLVRKPTATATPTVLSATGVASTGPADAPAPVSAPGPAVGRQLAVPAYSQMVHSGHYPEWGGGGASWCSPTSLAMVLDYYGKNPAKSKTWLGAHPDSVVDWTARMVYDADYDNGGNWAFNTAYAGQFLPTAYVTRLRDLTEVEAEIVAGHPVIVSVKFSAGQLTGAPITSTNGHLLVITGFAADGRVLVNDPAAPTDATVPRSYDRAQFERAWLSGSDGMAYLLH